MTPRQELKELKSKLESCHVSFDTYSPGDGITRYRFLKPGLDYFATSGYFTALGAKEALAYARGWIDGLQALTDRLT